VHIKPQEREGKNHWYFKFNAVDGYPESKRITDLPLSLSLSPSLSRTRITAASYSLLPGRHPRRLVPVSQAQSTHSAIDPRTLLSKQLFLKLAHHIQLAQDPVYQ
jgi:hypothetical protein